MTVFLELKDSDVISAAYTLHPSTEVTFNLPADPSAENTVGNEQFFIVSGAVKTSKVFEDFDGVFITSSARLSSSADFLSSASVEQKFAFNRLRNVYASNSFKKPRNYTSSSIYSASSPAEQAMTLISYPMILYGSEIKPHSFRIDTDENDVYTDDGLGGIYSGSELVGSIYYQHGIVHFGHNISWSANEQITSSFSGTNHVPVNMYRCRVPRGGMNFTQNPSYVKFTGSTNKYEILTDQPKTFITTVNLYDENYRKVGVAKTSTPILNEEETGIEYRIKLHF